MLYPIKVEQVSGKDLVVFSRDENGKRVMQRIEDFEPYFYYSKEDGKYIDLFGKKYSKKFTTKSTDVIQERENKAYDYTGESDVLYTQRFLIDRYNIPFEKVPLRICYFDIEVLDSLDVDNTPVPIISIVCFDNFLKRYIVFVWREDLNEKTEKNDVLIPEAGSHWKKEDTTVPASIYYFKDEKTMLNKFIDFIGDTQPDVLTAWNSDNYDFPYFANRCKKLSIDIKRLSPLKLAFLDEKYGRTFVVPGIYTFDLQKGYRGVCFSKLPSYSLEYVSQKEIKDGKVKHSESFTVLWKKKLKKLILYNIKDVWLLVKLDQQLGIINLQDDYRRNVGCIWKFVRSNSMMVDVLSLRQAKRDGIILPRKPKTKAKKFKGAEVLEPKRGIHINTGVADLKSLYPAIIISGNFSPETFSWEPPKSGKYNYIAEKGYYFDESKEGFLPRICKTLWNLRNEYKKFRKEAKDKNDERAYEEFDRKQYATKQVLNSIYGVMGFPHFRLYKPEVAAAVTFIGRSIILSTKDFCEKKSFKVLSGDTDSVFVKFPDDYTKKQIIEAGKELAQQLTKSYDLFIERFKLNPKPWLTDFETVNKDCRHVFFMQFEKIFKKMLILARKNYCGLLIWKDGKDYDKITFTGMASKRSDKNEMLKKVQRRVIDMLFRENKGLTDLQEYVEKTKWEIKSSPDAYKDLIIPQTIAKKFEDYKNLPCHVRAIQTGMKLLDVPFSSIKIRMLWVKHPQTNVIAVPEGYEELLKDFKIDYEHYFKLIFGRVNVIISAITKQQSTLDDFMKDISKEDDGKPWDGFDKQGAVEYKESISKGKQCLKNKDQTTSLERWVK